MFDQILQYLPEIGKSLLVLIAMGFAFGVKLLDPMRSSEARGRVGGVIYNTARGVRYGKVFTSPCQPRTQKQLAVRALFQMATRAWQLLSSPERDNWNDYGTAHPEIDWTGQPIAKSGFNWFTRLTTRLLWTDNVQSDTPPAVAAPDAPLAFSAATGILQSIITFTPGVNAINAIVYGVGPHSPGRVAKREQAVYMGKVDSDLGTITITGLSPGSYTFFGYMLSKTTGLISVMVSDTVVITAV
ncbi:MAG: hypothetical protein IMZ50_09485 [Candidatus Atribacteria bacterium]|nr:hypothetical protein [Candidatus Atribacteria bacterium]